MTKFAKYMKAKKDVKAEQKKAKAELKAKPSKKVIKESVKILTNIVKAMPEVFKPTGKAVLVPTIKGMKPKEPVKLTVKAVKQEPKTIMAGQAIVGHKYLTVRGNPVEVIKIEPKGVSVIALLTKKTYRLDPRDTFEVYSEAGISQEAKEFSRLADVVPSKARPTVNKLARDVARFDGKKEVSKVYKGQTLKLEVKADGFHVGGKVYTSLSASSKGVTGHESMTDGARFWGLTHR